VTATSAPARPAPVLRAHVTPPLSFARLLGIEVRRSPMPLILPLVAALFWFDSYRPSTSQAPFFPLVTFWNMGQGHTIIDFGPFVAGMAAWIGSRDGRRGTADLITATPCPRWAAQLAAWAAAAIWAVAAYLVFVGVMFAVYAERGVQGEPPWWWVAVGATAVAAFSAGGFTIGVLVKNRFAAPLAAFAGFLVLIMSSQTGFKDTSGWALVLPTNSNGNFQLDSGIFYPYLPDLPIARIVFLAGLAIAALGLAGLLGAAGERRIRIVAPMLISAWPDDPLAVSTISISRCVPRIGLTSVAKPSRRLNGAALPWPISSPSLSPPITVPMPSTRCCVRSPVKVTPTSKC